MKKNKKITVEVPVEGYVMVKIPVKTTITYEGDKESLKDFVSQINLIKRIPPRYSKQDDLEIIETNINKIVALVKLGEVQNIKITKDVIELEKDSEELE